LKAKLKERFGNIDESELNESLRISLIEQQRKRQKQLQLL